MKIIINIISNNDILDIFLKVESLFFIVVVKSCILRSRALNIYASSIAWGKYEFLIDYICELIAGPLKSATRV